MGKYSSLGLALLLCLFGESVKANEENFQNFEFIKNNTPEIVISQRKSPSIVLNGSNLTPQDVVAVAKHGSKVEISDTALERVKKSHKLLILGAEKGQKIYGLTVGVGLNKDQSTVNVGENGKLSEEVIEASKKFNRSLIYAHSAGAGSEMSQDVVRAIMVTRLNSVLYGATGAQPKVAELYRDFLNNDIVPIIPSKGSVGQADITLLSHIALAMIGEGEVYYKGEKIPAKQALERVGIEPLVPFGKDSLSIFSSNAYSEALGALAIAELEHVLKLSKLVFALSLEGFNGNIEPFLVDSNKVRPFPSVNRVSRDIREILNGSYLWDKSEERALQDPLSYRTSAYTIGVVESSLEQLKTQLNIQLNSSDDNPAVILNTQSPSEREEEKSKYVRQENLSGAVLPTANFSPLPWVISFQEAAIALSHLSNASAQRTIKLSNPKFTHLSRFLGTEKTVHAYGAIQKVFVSLAAENQELAIPVSIDSFAIAGNIEDMSTNAPRVVRRFRQQIDNLYFILGLEMMHASQAINLRMQKQPDLELSKTTKDFFEKYRKIVSFMETDRVLSYDIENSYTFLKNYN